MRKRVGVFHYAVEIVDASGERFDVRNPLVDASALYSQFPASFLESLGHTANATRSFRLADGSMIERRIGPVTVRIIGEVQPVICIFGGENSPELLGATTMEVFSLAPDPVNETLIPVVASLMSEYL